MGGDGGYQGKQLLSFSVGGVINPGSGNRNMSKSLLIEEKSSHQYKALLKKMSP